MIKKILLIIVIFIYTNTYSQVNFPNAKQCLKELLAMQALLAENRMDELKIFILNNNYHYLDETYFCKYDLLNPPKENDVIPVVTILNIVNQKAIFHDNYLKIIFIKIQNNKQELLENKEDLQAIESIIKSQYEIGSPYFLLKKYTNDNNPKEMVVEKVDRYNLKISSKMTEGTINVNASNFTLFPNNDKNKIYFLGPGKAAATIISHVHSFSEDPKYNYSIEIASLKNESTEKEEVFNIDFFMSLKNFNDRIWLDK
jgi:hypothetical protein